jgi:hypothetical protein
MDEAPLAEPRAVGDRAPVPEAGEVESPDVRDRLETVQLVVRGLDAATVGADRGVDALLVRPSGFHEPIPQIRYAKSASRGPRPAAFQSIATGPCPLSTA